MSAEYYYASAISNQLELRSLTSAVIKEFLPLAINRSSLLINDIPVNIFLNADKECITLILSKLLENTILSSFQGCIRINATQDEDYITVTIKDNHSDYSRYISGKMLKAVPLVKKAGGEIHFEFLQRNSIKIVLQFPTCKKAA